jgi:hypothetical protein
MVSTDTSGTYHPDEPGPLASPAVVAGDGRRLA